jgi:hypothetical protein
MAHLAGADGGKGSAPRKQSNQQAFAENWDRIFGKKKDEVVGTKKSGEILASEDSEL